MVAQTPRPMKGKQQSPGAQELRGKPGTQNEPRPPSGNGGSPPSKPPVEHEPDAVSQVPELHAMHNAPAEPWPHWVAVCEVRGMQRPDIGSQHPVEQFVAVHEGGGGRQLPFWHVRLWTVQSLQNWPCRPHWAFVLPVMQLPVPMSTQPVHGVQAPFTQVCVDWHAVHTAPLLPQRAEVGV